MFNKKQKNMYLAILVVLTILIILLVSFYTYQGGFYKPQITLQNTGGEVLVYDSIKGDYKQSGIVMDKIYYSLLNDDKVETFKGFGIYFDNPQKVEKSILRSEAGCILEKKDIDKLTFLETKYKIRTFPVANYIVTEFPYKNKLSVLFSLAKVYPALREFALKNGYNEDTPVMEIYDIPNKKIIYRKELIKNSSME